MTCSLDLFCFSDSSRLKRLINQLNNLEGLKDQMDKYHLLGMQSYF